MPLWRGKRNRKATDTRVYYTLSLFNDDLLKITSSTVLGTHGPASRPMERGMWQGFLGYPGGTNHLMELDTALLSLRLAEELGLSPEETWEILEKVHERIHKELGKCSQMENYLGCSTIVSVDLWKKYLQEAIAKKTEDEGRAKEVVEKVLTELNVLLRTHVVGGLMVLWTHSIAIIIGSFEGNGNGKEKNK